MLDEKYSFAFRISNIDEEAICEFQIACFFLDSTYRRSFNEAVLQLQETGVLSQLQRKWWEEKRGGGACMVSYYEYYNKS